MQFQLTAEGVANEEPDENQMSEEEIPHARRRQRLPAGVLLGVRQQRAIEREAQAEARRARRERAVSPERPKNPQTPEARRARRERAATPPIPENLQTPEARRARRERAVTPPATPQAPLAVPEFQHGHEAPPVRRRIFRRIRSGDTQERDPEAVLLQRMEARRNQLEQPVLNPPRFQEVLTEELNSHQS